MRALQDEWPALPHALPTSSSQKLYQTNILQMCSKYIVNLSNIIASSDECSVQPVLLRAHAHCTHSVGLLQFLSGVTLILQCG